MNRENFTTQKYRRISGPWLWRRKSIFCDFSKCLWRFIKKGHMNQSHKTLTPACFRSHLTPLRVLMAWKYISFSEHHSYGKKFLILTQLHIQNCPKTILGILISLSLMATVEKKWKKTIFYYYYVLKNQASIGRVFLFPDEKLLVYSLENRQLFSTDNVVTELSPNLSHQISKTSFSPGLWCWD